MAEIILKAGREKSVLRRHPWIFSGAIGKVNGNPKLGETVDVISSAGDFLAKAAYNANSNICGRIWTWDENISVDPKYFHECLETSYKSRLALADLIKSDSFRVVHGESDGLPGLILDKYQELCVVQYLTAGVEYWKDVLSDLIKEITSAKILFERSDQDVRELEGLPSRKGLLYGNSAAKNIVIQENGLKFYVDFIDGHKTGFYLDQRENRNFARSLSKGLNVLDCFSYTGGFGINALIGGAASITIVDSSSSALAIAKDNINLNNLNLDNTVFIEQDVFKHLRTLRDSGKYFDMIILDPPKFAPTTAQVDRAARGYKDINLLALKILKPGGFLLTFSCSGGVSEELFQKIVSGAALDAGIDAVIVKRMHQAVDHPVALNFPEGAYLKGFILQRRN